VPTQARESLSLSTDRRELDTNVLVARWRNDADQRARDALLHRFLPLARKLARRYVNTHEPFEDLVQVASLGLLAAIDRFDPERGVGFPSFAIPTILGELKRHFRNTGWAVHVARGPQEMALRIDQAVRQIGATRGHHPGVQELAEYLEVSTEDVIAGLDVAGAHYAASLDAPVAATDDEEPTVLIDTIGQVDPGYGLTEWTASLSDAVRRLPYLERRALTLRLEGDLKQTDIARELGCSQMQVSRLLGRAAEHLRTMTDPEVARR
jgi:RNA polymerase sigma-B factor